MESEQFWMVLGTYTVSGAEGDPMTASGRRLRVMQHI